MPNHLPNDCLPLDPDPLSIDRFTSYLERALLQTPELRQVWLCGEVASATYHPSGIYFNLKDKVGRASLPAVVWKSQIPELETKPQVGMEVLVFGKIAVYAPHGKYQFQVQQVLSCGEGFQALKLQKLRQRLSAEGLFDLDRKQPLPTHPQIIAVVTSPTAAAWGDIHRTLFSRYRGVSVLLSPAIVQGDAAPKSIEQAIERVVIDGRAEVLILARGGGSAEDLDCFNSEIVVRAISECPIPVVTGIGHERDESLADLAADVRAATPTASAITVVPALEDLVDEHAARVERLRGAIQRVLIERRFQLDRLKIGCARIAPNRQLKREGEQIDRLSQRLKLAVSRRLQTDRQELLQFKERLTALDPRLVLQRGYALVRNDRGIVRDKNILVVGEELSIQFGNGQAKVKVVEIDVTTD